MRINSLSVGKLLDLGRAASEVPEDFAGSIATVDPMLRMFADNLIEWNLEDDDGKPVPAKYAVCTVSCEPGNLGERCAAHAADDDRLPCEYTGIVGQEIGFIVPVIMRWMASVSGVDSPLPGTSNSGGTSPEASLQLAESSESLRN